MDRHSRPFFGIAFVALALAWCGTTAAASAAGSASQHVRSDAAVIVDAGDADSAGYRIVVTPDDHASAVDGAGKASGELDPALADRFFGDLRTAGASAATAACGSATGQNPAASITVAWNGRVWKNVGCAANADAGRIAADAVSIARALYVQRYRTRPMYVYLGSGGQYVSTGQQPPNVYGTAFRVGSTTVGGYSGRPFTTFAGYGTSPYSSYPPGAFPGGSLPGGSLTGTLPYTSLPGASPYSGLPGGSLPVSSPYSGGPYGSMPFTSP